MGEKMMVQSKFAKGQGVFFIENNSVQNGEAVGILVDTRSGYRGGIQVVIEQSSGAFGRTIEKYEDEVFESIEELKKQLFG